MKGKMKKVVGVLISAAMLLTMTMGVFAAGSSDVSSNGVTVKGATGVVVSTAKVQPTQSDITKAVGGNYSFLAAFDVSVESVAENGATLVFQVSGVTPSSKVAVLHYNGTSWENLGGTAGNGTVTVSGVKNFSPFAVVADKSTLTGTTKTGASPKTGETSTMALLGVVAVLAVAGAGYCFKKREVR